MKSWEGKKGVFKRGYFHSGHKIFHRELWISVNGPIPKGHVIHHKDGNRMNNSIENLQCMSHSEHSRLHARERKEELSLNMKNRSEDLHKWHKSEKGKKIMRERSKKQWINLPLKTFSCAHCNNDFQSKYNREVKFCSDNCVMKARRKSGIDNVERRCIICLNPFFIDKYQKTVTCSKPCRAKHIGNLRRKS